MSRWFFDTQQDIEDWVKRRQAAADEKALRYVLRQEGDFYSEHFPLWLAQMGIDHTLAMRLQPSLAEEVILGRKGRQMVGFLEVKVEKSAIYLHIDAQNLPYLVKLKHLYDPDVLETLSEQAGRTVLYRKTGEGNGAWFVVVRDGAINAIPKTFPYREAVAAIPKEAGPLFFVTGVAENNKIKHADLTDMPHYLVAGSTGTGKSVHLNQLLCTLIERNTPEQVQFILIDLKGTEFNFYENLPHLYRPIVTSPDGVCPILREYRALIKEREALFRSRNCKTIEEWNERFPKERIPYLVLAFDELSLIFLNEDQEMANLAASLLSGGLAVSRSAGIHCILCTQLPSSEVIKSHLKVNLPERISFRVPSNSNSMVVIDTGDASKLPHHPGRAMHSRGADLTEIQSPFITNNEITKIVRAAIERGGKVAPRDSDEVTIEDILLKSVTEYGGLLHLDTMALAFRGRISRDKVRDLIAGLNGDPLTIDGRVYKCQNKGRGKHGGRMLVAIEPVPSAEASMELPSDSAAFGELPPIKFRKGDFGLKSPHEVLTAPASAAATHKVHQD